MAPTSRDVAIRAGVSQSTVSRVLTNDPRVRASTREHVLAVLAEMDYAPNRAARSMKTGMTGAIGVAISRLTNPYYPELLDAVAQAIVATGRHMVVWNTEAGGEADAMEALRQRTVDGVLLATATDGSARSWAEIDPRSPVVLINRTVAGLPFPQVAGADADGGAEVARLFADHGRRPCGLLTAPASASTTAKREDGFRRGLEENGVELSGERVARAAAVSHEEGRLAMTHLLRQGAERPSAVFCVSDLLAAGALDAARELAVRVPEDLWIAGFDDVALASWGAYQLTTVRQPVDEIARLGVEALVERMNRPDAPARTVILPTRLVVRQSARSWS